uniref:ATP-dependent DNA helicase n=1 Tax=Fopius arisanus TaxID=64838 RepID=A0A0C9Q9F9_9HYME
MPNVRRLGKERFRKMRAQKLARKSARSALERSKESRDERRQRASTSETLRQSSLPADVSPTVDNARETPSTSTRRSRKSGTSRPTLPYASFGADTSAHRYFKNKFHDNPFGLTCDICDRLWFQSELKTLTLQQQKIIARKFPSQDVSKFSACKGCIQALARDNIPTFAKFNGFQYPDKPPHLPQLNSISERLISPRIPFLQIRRLRNVQNQDEIFTQIVNVPVSENNMVYQLPRSLFDDHCINVRLDQKRLYESAELMDFVNKPDIQVWLDYLLTTPLYTTYDIKIYEPFFDDKNFDKVPVVNLENIPKERNIYLYSQQQTLLWNVDKYLQNVSSEVNVPYSMLFDDHAEELSFPTIYLGQFRIFKDGFRITPFTIVTSELRRTDRRGVTPQHLLYMAMKIMRMRVHDALSATSKFVGKDWNAVREHMFSEEYLNHSLETNLAFLKCIPNSSWYWAERKRDLFTMLRQLGKPTMSLTLSTNETGWLPLIQLLYRLKHGVEISERQASQLDLVDRSLLVNEDTVTCAIYFSKLLNVLMTILQSKKSNPFEQYHVTHYFQHIEFLYNGSPQARILLWLNKDPKDPLGANAGHTLKLIDKLISVSRQEASGFIEHQIHRHTFQCYTKESGIGPGACKFGAPFLPSRTTMVLIPHLKTDVRYVINLEHYKIIRKNLEINNYVDFDSFYDANGITSDEHYVDIIRAGIDRPKILVKREPSETWHESFNPFILNILNANMNIDFISDKFSCADYVADYLNKANRGISDLRRRILGIMKDRPTFNMTEITKELSAEILRTVEITTQEAAWYLLREPTSKTSTPVIYIPTVRPSERPKIRKNHHQLIALDVDDDSPEVWKENWYDKYEKRPKDLENVTLAQFVANYTRNFNNSSYVRRRDPCLIRYHNYDMMTDPDEYRREMVTLHVPFRNEQRDIIANNRFIQLYNKHEQAIFDQRRDFESDLDVQSTINKFRQFRDEAVEDEIVEVPILIPIEPESDPLAGLDPVVSEMDYKSDSSTVTSDSPIFVKREMLDESNTNSILFGLLTKTGSPFKVFLSGSVSSAKPFIMRIMTEIYNRYKNADENCGIFTNYSSVNQIEIGTSSAISTILRTSLPNMLSLSVERAEQFRDLFDSIQIVVIDEVDAIGASVVAQIDTKLKQITGCFDLNFGRMSVILVGKLAKLPPVQLVSSSNLLNTLKFLELKNVMQQSNALFKVILTKMKAGNNFEDSELRLLESRFFSEEEADRLCPHGIRIFQSHQSVNDYNRTILDSAENKIVSTANDVLMGCSSDEQETYVQEFLKMSIVETRGLPYEIIFVMFKLYMVTTNYDVGIGLVAGAFVQLVSIERHVSGEVTKVWLKVMNPQRSGDKSANRKRKRISSGSGNGFGDNMVPMVRRRWSVPLNDEKTIIATRDHFPLLPACAVTPDVIQGKRFDEMVCEYSENQTQQQVYSTLSIATNITNLYIINQNNDSTFHHGRKTAPLVDPLAQTPSELLDLTEDKSLVMDKVLIDFIIGRKTISVLSFDHETQMIASADLNAVVSKKPNVLLLLETYPDDEDRFKVPDFNCEMRFKCSRVRTNSVAIHHEAYDKMNIVTEHMDIHFRKSVSLISNSSEVGEICGARCLLDNDQIIVTAMIYVSPGHSVGKLLEFIHEVLLGYTVQGAALLKKDFDKIPMIFGGHFNMNFTTPEAQPLINFLKSQFGLIINNDPAITPSDSGVTIDALFSRNLDMLESTSYVLYSSYDRRDEDDNDGS